MNKRRTPAYAIALGGSLAALAVTIMSLGTLIPIATYVCPVLCMVVLNILAMICGDRIGWAWYGAVALLSALLAPDKEAAAMFIFLGYYPLIKPKLDKTRLKWLWKILFFNVTIFAAYWFLMHLLGMAAIAEEFREMGAVLTAAMLVLGNLTFFLLDRLLSRNFRRKK